ncbi:hypothetical protein [Pseudomonas sp. GXZC]|uniref:hypothetical protein n=1 Tax=Pseudomonas sp. GXZC TaxID=3003351 RepID=UPI0022AAD299|nr:hypothetical protein [Pseudomonas sp. GXZC]WAT25703.1 hypothetical protein OZ428_17085 [Pseudomonas sp. GXZC]
MTFVEFWWSTAVALAVWAVLTASICIRVRSGKVWRRSTAARQNIILGLLLVLLSAVPPAFLLDKLDDFKATQDAESLDAQTKSDKTNADTERKRCGRALSEGKQCDEPKPGSDISSFSKPLYRTLDKFVDVIGLVLGLLGGALGVNILSDGLLRKDVSPMRLVRREVKTTRTIGFSNWQIKQVTTKTCTRSSENV